MTDLPIENVQDYPRPPAIRPVPQPVSIELAGQPVAHSARALAVLETHHAPTYYIPRADFTADLTTAPGRSFCEWKGWARYWDIAVTGGVAHGAGWDYPRPHSAYQALTGHVAVYAQAMQSCTVGTVTVAPQAGDFYGGWITPNLRGNIKGKPGTETW